MKKPLYLVITSIDGLGNGYEAFRSLGKATVQARATVASFGGRHHFTETNLPALDPSCHLHITWGSDEDNSVSVIEVPVRA